MKDLGTIKYLLYVVFITQTGMFLYPNEIIRVFAMRPRIQCEINNMMSDKMETYWIYKTGFNKSEHDFMKICLYYETCIAGKCRDCRVHDVSASPWMVGYVCVSWPDCGYNDYHWRLIFNVTSLSNPVSYHWLATMTLLLLIIMNI